MIALNDRTRLTVPLNFIFYSGIMSEQITGTVYSVTFRNDTNGYTVLERSPAGKRVEPGAFLKREYWGKGYVTEALEELLRFAFEEDGVRRVDTCCLSDNLRSAQAMEKSGMIFEGERRGFEWHVDSVKSRRYYGLLKEEWEEQHGKR